MTNENTQSILFIVAPAFLSVVQLSLFSNKSVRQWINGDNPHKIKRALMLTTIT